MLDRILTGLAGLGLVGMFLAVVLSIFAYLALPLAVVYVIVHFLMKYW